MKLKALMTILGILAVAAPGRATLLYDIPTTSPGSPFAGFIGNWGFNFTLTTSTTVKSLGLWDEGADGLLGPHTVGIFPSSGGSAIVSAVVNNSSTAVVSSSSNGRWLFTDITPVTLPAGTYTLGFYNQSGSADTFRGNVSASYLTGASFTRGQGPCERNRLCMAGRFK